MSTFTSTSTSAATSTQHEKERIMKSLGSFNPHQSHAWKEIQKRFGSGIVHKQLISLVRVLIGYFRVPKIGRNEKRSFQLLIKWFEEHWEQIEPLLSNIALLTDEEERTEEIRGWDLVQMM
jgi:hypothetical protein